LAIDEVEVDEWELAGPLADRLAAAPVVEANDWSRLLDRVVAAKAGVAIATPEMHCVARELGRFILAKGGRPSESLRRFIAARCGAPVSGVSAGFLSGDVPADVSEAAIFEKWKGGLENNVQAQMASGNRALGIWFGREGERAVVTIVSASREVHVQPASLIAAQDGSVVLQGELLIPAAKIRALVNRGDHAVGECEIDPTVKLPRFAIRCVTDRADPTAWIDVGAFPAGRILGRSVLELLVSPNGAMPSRFARRRPVSDAVGGTSGTTGTSDDNATFVTALNAFRQSVGLSALREAKEQSATALAAAPHYFAALLGHRPETTADTVVLGLRAGWQVPGLVRHGHFTHVMTSATSASGLVAAALDRPSAREAFLDPAASWVAAAILRPADAQLVVGVVCTYAVQTERDAATQHDALVAKLDAKRAEKSLPPIVRLDMGKRGARVAEQIAAGEMTPSEGVEDLLSWAAARHKGAKGWGAEASSIDEMKLPDELVARPEATVGILVVSYRPRNEPWVRVAALFIVVDKLRTDEPPPDLLDEPSGPDVSYE
jgi:hypothetical protein